MMCSAGDDVLTCAACSPACVCYSSLKLPDGVLMGPDARGGAQPHSTVVRSNLAHEIGLWQKQSSLWFQAVTAASNISGNVFFNGPRAALNFNDGVRTCASLRPLAFSPRATQRPASTPSDQLNSQRLPFQTRRSTASASSFTHRAAERSRVRVARVSRPSAATR